jgi:hypothetical protein
MNNLKELLIPNEIIFEIIKSFNESFKIKDLLTLRLTNNLFCEIIDGMIDIIISLPKLVWGNDLSFIKSKELFKNSNSLFGKRIIRLMNSPKLQFDIYYNEYPIKSDKHVFAFRRFMHIIKYKKKKHTLKENCNEIYYINECFAEKEISLFANLFMLKCKRKLRILSDDEFEDMIKFMLLMRKGINLLIIMNSFQDNVSDNFSKIKLKLIKLWDRCHIRYIAALINYDFNIYNLDELKFVRKHMKKIRTFRSYAKNI